MNIINKPMFINGDDNWVNLINEDLVTYNNNIQRTINMSLVDASNNPDKVRYYITSTKATSKYEVGDIVRNADKRNIFSKGYTSNWSRELFKVNQVLKAQPLTYRIEDINGEIIEGMYYEQELNIVLNVNKYKDGKKQIQPSERSISNNQHSINK